MDKALSLAVDLGAWDLFTDARWAALRVGNRAIAEEAHALALDYANAHRPGTILLPTISVQKIASIRCSVLT